MTTLKINNLGKIEILNTGFNFMNYINELDYASHIAKANKSARDKRQKNKYYQSELLENDTPAQVDDDTSVLFEPLEQDLWQGEERRKGNDRREICHNRGRYLESRVTKNRRYRAELNFTI